MSKISKILTISFIAVFIVGGGIFLAEKNVLENNYSSRVTISENNKTRIYNSEEDVILGGTAMPETEILLSWDNQLGLVESNKDGKWAVNLGKISEGKYNLQMMSNAFANNRSVATAQIVINNSLASQNSQVSLIDNILNYFSAALSLNSKIVPDRLVIIPQSTPSVLQGDWNLVE